ncbi:MAG: ABC transporter ATP-binding protein [Pirellulales bacterium]|jgi:iron complex transport system ATP-binding protein
MPPLLELDRVSVCRGGTHLLRELSLTLPDGRHTAILGPNGAGKTSLLRVLERELYPSIDVDGQQGSVRILGRSEWDVSELRRRMGIVSAMLDRDFSHGRSGQMTAAEAVSSGFTATRLTAFSVEPTAAVCEAVAAALARVSATHLASRTLATLSTGERRRVLIARSLVHAPELLVLDEPTTGLDLAARHQFLTILSGLTKQPGLTLLLVTHHLEEIVPGFEHVVLLQRGQVAFDGPTSEALTPARLSTLFGVPVSLTCDSSGHHTAAVVSPETSH